MIASALVKIMQRTTIPGGCNSPDGRSDTTCEVPGCDQHACDQHACGRKKIVTRGYISAILKCSNIAIDGDTATGREPSTQSNYVISVAQRIGTRQLSIEMHSVLHCHQKVKLSHMF